MTENEVAKVVVDVGYRIHSRLGPGLLESVYEVIMAHELEKRGLRVRRQVPVEVVYDGITFEMGFRADLVVEDVVLVELKSVEEMAYVHGKQVLTYLRLTHLKLGLLINFGAGLFKHGVQRVVNGLPEDS